VWALPFLTCLCPSQRYDEQRGRAHRKLTDRARQMLLLMSKTEADMIKVPRVLFKRLTEMLCYAA
jgi:hypothetical protein